MLIKKMKYNLTAYHCPNCGGIGDPKLGKCLYCGGKFFYKEPKKRKVRVLIDGYRDYVYYDNILDMEIEEHCNTATYIDTTGEYHLANWGGRSAEIRLIIPATNDGVRKTLQLRENIRETRNARIEFLERDLALETKCYLGNSKIEDLSTLSVAKHYITLVTEEDIRKFDTVVPEGCTCPNCGAPIKSRYGCCDYCSGWVEWSF